MRQSLSRGGLFALLILVFASPALAQSGAGQDLRSSSSTAESARFLLVPIGARMVGMGGTFAASRADMEGVLWNPASIASLGHSAVFFHASNDFGTASQVLGALGMWKGAQLGVTYYHFDPGSVDARDAANRDIGILDLDNDAFILSVAYPLSGMLDIGLNYKLLRLLSDCSGPCEAFDQRSTGHVFDLGFVLTPPRLAGLTVGAVLRNLGPGIAYADDGPSDPLPARLRVGAAIDLLRVAGELRSDEPEMTLLLQADLQQTFSEFDDLDGTLGAELGYRGLVFVRGGFMWAGEGRRGPTLGIGLRYDRIRLDVGRAFDDFSGFDTDTPFQVSLGFRL
jgi:hypothetical protein